MWQLYTLILFSVSPTAFGNYDGKGNYKIINGTETPITEIPWQVAQLVPQSPGPDQLKCGGSIIAMTKILTAGHCFKLSSYDVLKSYYRAGSSHYNEGGSIHHIKSYIVHPEYSYQEGINFYMQNDIAIVTVEETFIYSPAIKPVDIHDKMPTDFVKAQVSGWGITDPYRLNSHSKSLLSDKITVFNRDKCFSELGINILCLPESFFCMGEKGGGNGICVGDSGGPVTVDKKLVGITSGTTAVLTLEDIGKKYGCGFRISASMIQSVAPYVKWIQDNVKTEKEIKL